MKAVPLFINVFEGAELIRLEAQHTRRCTTTLLRVLYQSEDLDWEQFRSRGDSIKGAALGLQAMACDYSRHVRSVLTVTHSCRTASASAGQYRHIKLLRAQRLYTIDGRLRR